LLSVSKTKVVPLQPNLKLITKKMYAIVEIAGQQFKVEKDRYLYTHRLVGEVGAALVFDKVLLVDNEGDIKIGLPTVAGASVSGKVLAHVRGEKVLVFKKKRRKGYQKQNGHRQDLTKVLIEGITF
jgi:large subunit ribosomal protein L21